MPGSYHEFLAWEDVLPAAEQAFRMWTHRRELDWARAAWEHLTAAGLTTYRSDLERCLVCIRLFALAQIFLDWCSTVDEQDEYDDLSGWAKELEVGAFRLGQLVGNSYDITSEGDDFQSEDALELLTKQERPKVRRALLTGFESESGLFLSLWRINNPAPMPKPSQPPKSDAPAQTASSVASEIPSLLDLMEEEEPADEDDDVGAEDDWEVLNHITEVKMCGFEWIVNGCPSVR